MTDGAIEGPVLDPASGNPARQLVVLLHGYGADGNDLIPLASAWRSVLPDAAFLSPNAPQVCDEYPIGRQWFPLSLRDPSELARGVDEAAPGLDGFLDAALAVRGLGNRDLALVGFSQGAMMALAVGLRRDPPIAGIVSFSGVLTTPPPARGAYPPVLLGHGAEDPLIPAVAMEAARQSLDRAGVAVEAMLRPGLAHGIDESELNAGARFLAANLPDANS